MHSFPKDIEEYFKQPIFQRPFYLCCIWGNAGDALITTATFQLLHKLGLKFHVVHDQYSFDPEGKVVVIPPGGNLIASYAGARSVIERTYERAARIVILPATITGNEDLLAKIDGKADILCREKVTYDYVSGITKEARVCLMDDMAFGLDVDAVLNSVPVSLFDVLRDNWSSDPPRTLLKTKKPWALWCVSRKIRSGHVANRSRGPVLNAIRIDGERTGVEISHDNVDVSNVFSFGNGSELLSLMTASGFMRYLNRFKTIRTNRLHVAIGGALLNKEVEFYPNSYFKCESVFRQSIEGKYNNVKWMG